MQCPHCGMIYDSINPSDVELHEKMCSRGKWGCFLYQIVLVAMKIESAS